jgi:hypothetical protein
MGIVSFMHELKCQQDEHVSVTDLTPYLNYDMYEYM